MAAARSSAPIPMEPFWKTPAAKIMLAVVICVAAIFGIRKLEKINARYQVEARLARDPSIGPTLEKWRTVIAKNQTAQSRPGDELPMALYFGRVLTYAESKPPPGQSPTRTMQLANAQLLAGRPSKSDVKDVIYISFKKRDPGLVKPVPGQEWLVAVSRDSVDNNVIHTAYKIDPQRE